MLSEEITRQPMSKENEKNNLSPNEYKTDDVIKNYIPEIIEIDNSKLLKSPVVLKNVTARWSKQNSMETLQKINVYFQAGKLSVIIGSVGSGKVCANFI